MARYEFIYGMSLPPNGYVYRSEAVVLRGMTREAIDRITRAHFNGRLPDDYDEVMVRETCLHNPRGWCRDRETGKTDVGIKHISDEDAWKATKDAVEKTSSRVDDDEYFRRLAICGDCPRLKKLLHCSSCSTKITRLRNLIGRRHAADQWYAEKVCVDDGVHVVVKCRLPENKCGKF